MAFYQITMKDKQGFSHPAINEIVESESPEAAINQYWKSQEPEDFEALQTLIKDENLTISCKLRGFDSNGVMRVAL